MGLFMMPPCAIWAVVVPDMRLMGTDLSALIDNRAIFPDFSSSVMTACAPIETLSPGLRSILRVAKIDSRLGYDSCFFSA